ncbi:MarR family winged helix-turn-helix transcriptional regulator [Winogradskya consettensis]|uniref:MarR family transcriptional regulator n=1 Tax=Winogradskya consettensis TaxID=113560 RepID=A0A919SWZ2_9ACTN|nr:MarR family transcriptional regulator [Actinoplanes consettensis]GIM78638.1 MarR family transcriptional regulator [Actinoplanes consettensis]
MSAAPLTDPPLDPDPLLPLSDDEMAVMRAFGRLMLVMPRMLDTDLERDQRMSLSEYSVLRHLSESEGGIMRMSELAAACDMSLSGMTRLAGKLETLGYVRRTPCVTDGRGSNALLTEAGLARLREAWPAHLSSVRRRIFDHLGDVDLVALAKAMESMAG